MAIKESALSLITSIAQGDWIRAVTSAGASRRVTVANLAKAIVESYTGSSLAGSNQSVKAAIDSLNSKVTVNGANAQYKAIFAQASMTFSSGTATFDLSSIATTTGVSTFAGVAFAVPANTGTVNTTGAQVSSNTLTVRAHTGSSAYSGTLTVNYLVFGN